VLLVKHYSSEEIQMNKWVGYMACSRETSGPYRVLVGRTEGKSALGRPRRRREDNIKMYLLEYEEG